MARLHDQGTSISDHLEGARTPFSLRSAHLGCKLCGKRLCHSHSGGGRRELLLIDDAVHFAGLAAGTGGRGPWKEVVTGQYSGARCTVPLDEPEAVCWAGPQTGEP